MSAKLTATIELHAGGGWEGHTFFLVKHPISGEYIARTNFLEDVERACAEHGLHFDDSIKEILYKSLKKTEYGYVVPPEHLDKSQIVSSCSRYLKKLQEDYF